MYDQIDHRQIDLCCVQRIQHAHGLVVGGGRRFGDADRSGLLVQLDKVGECAADIDANDRSVRHATSRNCLCASNLTFPPAVNGNHALRQGGSCIASVPC